MSEKDSLEKRARLWPETVCCMDCAYHHQLHLEEDCPWPKMCDEITPFAHTWPQDAKYCPHFTPEWWVAQGYERYWGDAAVNDFPNLEILRKESDTRVDYIILNERTRRPITIWMNKETGDSWGGY